MNTRAGVAELVDAPDSKSGDSNIMRVQVPPPAPVYFEISNAAVVNAS